MLVRLWGKENTSMQLVGVEELEDGIICREMLSCEHDMGNHKH